LKLYGGGEAVTRLKGSYGEQGNKRKGCKVTTQGRGFTIMKVESFSRKRKKEFVELLQTSKKRGKQDRAKKGEGAQVGGTNVLLDKRTQLLNLRGSCRFAGEVSLRRTTSEDAP